MAGPTQLPAYIQLRYDENGVFSRFQSDTQAATEQAQRSFTSAFGEIERVVGQSFASISSQGGRLDLGLSGLRDDAAKLRAYSASLDETLGAARRLAAQTEDTSDATKRYLQALSAQNEEARRAADAATAQATSYERLQSEIDKTASASSRLANAQREIYAESAKAARAARDSQELYNIGFGFDRQAKSAKSSASVFENFGYRPNVDQRDGVQRLVAGDASIDRAALAGVKLEQVLRRVSAASREASQETSRIGDSSPEIDRLRAAALGAAEGARLLSAIHADTALAIDRTTNSARASAAVFQAHYAEIEKNEQAQRELAASVDELRAELDPMFAAQQRFDAELARAERLYERGAISAREYAAAQQLARNNLNGAARAIMANGDAVDRVAKRGTNAAQSVINSQRAMRFAGIQLGQQMQDVVVQAQLGTNAFVIFSQQVPQAAFALSGLADSANKTQARIGQFATFLSGPWGAAIFAATAILGPFLYNLIASGDAAEDAAGKTYDFADGLNVLELSANETSNAMRQLVQEMRNAIAVQGDYLRQKALIAGQSARDIETRLGQNRSELRGIEDSSGPLDFAFRFGSSIVDERRAADLRAQIAKDEEALRLARKATVESELAVSQSNVLERLDPSQAVTGDYNRQIGELNDARRASAEDAIGAQSAGIYISKEEYEAEFERITRLKDARLDAIREADRESRSSGRGKRSTDAEARREQRETERLARISDSAAESIARVNEQFDDQPRLVDKSAQAVRRLQAIIDELNDPKNAETPRRAELVAEALDAQAVAARAVATEIERYGEATDRNLDIMRLQAAGLDEQAQILAEIARIDEQLGLDKRSEALREQKADLEDILVFETLTAEQRAQTEAAIASVNAELEENGRLQQRRNDEAEYRVQTERRLQQQIARTNDLMRAQLNVLDTAREGLIDLLSGRSTNLFGDLKQALADLKGARLFDQIFGDAFDVLEDELRSRSPLGRAAKRLEAGVDEATVQTDNLATAAEIAAERILAATDPLIAANDNPVPGTSGVGPNGEIVVTGERGGKVEIEQLSVSQIADKMADAIVSPLLEGMDDIFGTAFTQQMGAVLKGALSGYMQAGTVGGVIGGLKGISDEVFGAGSGVSGALGNALGGAQFGTQLAGLADMFGIGMSNDGAAIGGAIGSALPIPGGQIIGSIAGGFIGGLFKSNKTARALLTGGDDMDVAGAWTSKYGIAEGLGGTVLDALNRIADELGGDVGSFYTSIGVRGGDYRVNTDSSSLKIKNGAVNFGDDQEAATRFAILDAITDGAIKGISDAEQRLLREGKDLDSALQDVFDFRSVFDRLKQYKDPVGYALDQVDKEFEDLIDLFERAGASAEEFAQLEELYGIERAKAIEEASERINASLKSLLDELTIGDSGLSLRSRQQNALAEYQPLAERVAAGDTTAYDDYADAARSLLDIERQMFGSTQAYFDRLDEVTSLTRERIDGDSNIASIAANRESPFDSAGRVKDSIDSQTGEITNRLDAVNDNLITIIRQMGFAGTGGGTFDYRAWYEAYAF